MDDGRVADIAAERQDGAVRHVEHVERAIDQRQADGGDCVHGAKREAGSDDLDQDVHRSHSEIGFDDFRASHQFGAEARPGDAAIVEQVDRVGMLGDALGILLDQ